MGVGMGVTPTAQEQLLLQYTNRARANPQAEMDRQFNTNNADVNNAITYFGSSESAAKAQVKSLPSAAPLAWNTNLAKSADTHNDLMITFDKQSHNLPGEPNVLDRIANAGFDFSLGGSVGENVYAFSRSIEHAHAGFYIDWGNGPNGMQNPAGHRNAILSPSYTQVGLAISTVPAGKSVGPLAITQHFAEGPAEPGPFLVGVAIDDKDNDDFYDVGEGLGGVTVTATGAGGTFTTTTWASGGYALTVAPNSAYNVTFSGQGVDYSTTVNFGKVNLAVDAEKGNAPINPGSGSGSGTGSGAGAGSGSNSGTAATTSPSTTPSANADNIRGGFAAELISAFGGNDSVKAGSGADTVNGGTGDDRLIGGKGNDVLIGGPGNDWIGGQSGSDSLSGDGGNDTIRGAGGNDTIDGGAGIDHLRGHTGRDEIYGGSGDDFVYGDVDNDLLFGDGGNDRIKGGYGSDQMVGGAGRDLFHIDHGGSKTDGDFDRIADFHFGVDILVIDALSGGFGARIETREELQSLSLAGVSVAQSGQNVRITFDDGTYSHVLLLENNDLFA